MNWHGFVVGDYKAVMALPWKRKFGIRYGYTPAFIQQMGLSGYITDHERQALIRALHKFVRFADLNVNFSNTFPGEIAGVGLRTNFIINLDKGHAAIRAGYRNDLTANIKKAASRGMSYGTAEITDGVSLFRQQYGQRLPKVTEYDYQAFLGLCATLQHTGGSFARAAFQPNGELAAIAVLFQDARRIYNIMNTTLPAGRDTKANHFLLDNIIAEFAGQRLIFDFEGSDLPGVHSFYKQFSALDQPYFKYRYNHLPWPLRLWKR